MAPRFDASDEARCLGNDLWTFFLMLVNIEQGGDEVKAEEEDDEDEEESLKYQEPSMPGT